MIKELESDQGAMFKHLSNSWSVIVDLEHDIRMWQEHSQHDDKDREMLQRQLTKVLEEKQSQERAIMEQNDELLQENI